MSAPLNKSPAANSVWFKQDQAKWMQSLSDIRYDIIFEHDRKIAMRDGVRLSANVWRPAAEGKFPVVFVFTPYDNAQATWVLQRVKYFVPRGYVVAAVDVRGRYDSEGTSYLYWSTNWDQGRFDGEDAYDCQTWLGEQPWSSGRIGMTGGSYLAFVQWMSAPLQNKYLKALIPWISPDDHYDNVFPNGAFQLSNSLNLLVYLGTGTHDNKEDLRLKYWDWPKLYKHLPLSTMDLAFMGKPDQLWQDFINHPDNDSYWRFSVGDRPRVGAMGAGKYGLVRVPTLNITGWYDQVSQATINNYLGMIQFGPPELRKSHQLIVGPWRHGSSLSSNVGDTDFGTAAAVDHLLVEHRWFDYWLKEIKNGILDEPPVSLFVMGENYWRSEQEWPLARATVKSYFIERADRHSGLTVGGQLTCGATPGPGADSYVYNPEDPVPTLGGNVMVYPQTNIGPIDQRPLGQRADILRYTSPPHEHPLEVTGRIIVTLFAQTTATDTDFTAKLSDVFPDGSIVILCEGIIRGRYRRSFKSQELLEPGRCYEFQIDLWSISHVFQTNHRIQLDISSSNFPKYDRNPNTGHKFGLDAILIPATQTVHWGGKTPSRIDLPVIPRSDSKRR
jgi:hypothetical protein